MTRPPAGTPALGAFVWGAALILSGCGEETVRAPFVPRAPAPEPEARAAPIRVEVSATGADFIEWSWNGIADATVAAGSEYEVEWAFWEDWIGARNSFRTADRRFRLRVEPDTVAWLRVRRDDGEAPAAAEWSEEAVEGRSRPAPCETPEVFSARPDAGPLREVVRSRITIERPPESRPPSVRVLRPYSAALPPVFEPFRGARLLSWTTTPRENLVRDELSLDWPHSSRSPNSWLGAGELAPELYLRIVAAGCAEVVTVRCSDTRCAVDP